MKPLLNNLKTVYNGFINALLPIKCLCGRNYISENFNLCAECWSKINFISDPKCETCGDPFNVDLQELSEQECPNCIINKPQYTKARCSFKYDKNSSFIISKFKYSDATYIAKFLSRYLKANVQEMIGEVDYITSVPIHKNKLMKRKYNQAALLANELGKVTKKAVDNRLLLRKKNNLPQASLEREKRLVNVKGSFEINPKLLHAVKGKNILLVDDVITTGATINECSKILLKAGASKVFVTAAGRTILEG